MLLKKKCNNLDEYSLHHSKSTLSKRIYEISYWICINVKHIKPNYSQLGATKKIKIFSDLYSLKILIDDPGIRARWYATIRSEPRIRSGLLARRGEGGSVPTNRRKLVAGIYDVSARYGCYAFHPWFVFGVMLKSRFGLDPWMLLHLNEQYISPDSLVFQIFFKFQRDLEYRRKSYFLLEYSWML